MRWRGPIGPALIAYLGGSQAHELASLADPLAWALTVLGFPPGSERPSNKEITKSYRARMRAVHPDHGGDREGGRRPTTVPSHQPALRANLDRRHHQSRLRRMAKCLCRRRQDDHGSVGSSHASLRDHRDRKRFLALQKPLSKLKPKPLSTAPDQAVQPRPATPDRVLAVVPSHQNRGPFCAKIRGPDSAIIDNSRSA